jgi:membrane-associated phospholipid phosphatase
MAWRAGRAGATPAGAWAVATAATLVAVAVLYLFTDRPLSVRLRDAPVWLIDVAQAVTAAGDSRYTLVPLALAVAVLLAARRAVRGERAAALYGWLAGAAGFLFTAVAGSGLLVNAMKVLIGRARPKLLDEAGVYGFDPFSFGYAWASFPSGHANTLVALAVGLAFLAPRLGPVLLTAAAVLALSRVAINAHFLGDVVAGAALAVATTVWLRARLADRGLVFVRRAGGRIGLAPPGRRLVRAAGLAGRAGGGAGRPRPLRSSRPRSRCAGGPATAPAPGASSAGRASPARPDRSRPPASA